MFILTKVLLLLIAVYFIVNVLMILIHQLHLFDSNNATASSSSSLYMFTKIFSNHNMNTAEKRFIPLSYLDTIDQYRSRVPGLIYNLSDTVYINTRNAPHQEKKEEEENEGDRLINSLHYHKVGDLLLNWHPENVSPLKWIQSACHPNNNREEGKTGSSSSSSSSHQCIPRVDYIHGKAWIHTYRNAEIPFIIYNIPELIATIESNFTIQSLLKNIGGSNRVVEVSHSNRFLYYYTKKPLEVIQKRYPGWLPPQRSMTLTFEEYLRHMTKNEELYTHHGNNRHRHHHHHHHHREAHDHVDNHDIDTDNDVINNKISLKYLSLFFSKSEMDTDIDNTTTTSSSSCSSWVKHSLSILTPANKELFYGNTDYRYRGIVCRFSMRGTTGTAHFDSKRNFVAVIRGRRR
jgi:hypothetical protein